MVGIEDAHHLSDERCFLKQASRIKKRVIVPWMVTSMGCFATYDLKYLEDPKKLLVESKTINTMVRKRFRKRYAESLSSF